MIGKVLRLLTRNPLAVRAMEVGNDVSLRLGKVDEPRHYSARRDSVYFSVIRFHGVKHAIRRDQAVPGSIRLKIIGFRILRGMQFLVRAQANQSGPAAVGIDLQNGVRRVGMTVRAACPSQQRVHLVADEGDIRHTLDIADGGTG